MSLFRPSIDDKSPWLRARAVKGVGDPATLQRIALTDASEKVRKAAFKRITDQRFLAAVVMQHPDPDTQLTALDEIADPSTLAALALKAPAEAASLRAAEKIRDTQLLLALFTQEGAPSALRMHIVRRLSDPEALIALFRKTDNEPLRLAIVEKVADKQFLVTLARDPRTPFAVRLAAAKKSGETEIAARLEGIARDFIIQNQRLVHYRGDGKNVVVPVGVRVITAGAFFKTSAIQELVLPATVEAIEPGAFNRVNVRRVRLHIKRPLSRLFDSMTATFVLGPGVADAMSLYQFGCINVLGFEVEEGNGAYSALGGLLYTRGWRQLLACPRAPGGEIRLADQTESIRREAFKYVKGVESVYVPPALKEIRELSELGELRNCEVAADNPFFSGVGGSIFDKAEETLCFVPPKATSVTVPRRARTLDALWKARLFDLERVVVDPDNASFRDMDGVLYDKEGKTLLYVPFKRRELEVAPTAERVADQALAGNHPLESLVLPRAVGKLPDVTRLRSLKRVVLNKAAFSGALCALFPEAADAIEDPDFHHDYGERTLDHVSHDYRDDDDMKAPQSTTYTYTRACKRCKYVETTRKRG